MFGQTEVKASNTWNQGRVGGERTGREKEDWTTVPEEEEGEQGLLALEQGNLDMDLAQLEKCLEVQDLDK